MAETETSATALTHDDPDCSCCSWCLWMWAGCCCWHSEDHDGH